MAPANSNKENSQQPKLQVDDPEPREDNRVPPMKNAYDVLQSNKSVGGNKGLGKRPKEKVAKGLQPKSAKAKQTLVYETVGQDKVVKTAQKRPREEQRWQSLSLYLYQ